MIFLWKPVLKGVPDIIGNIFIESFQ